MTDEANGERLGSWKEIATYLKRTVRTVHRWEKEEGLPVHRHLHKKQGTIYAYTSELDAWWQKRAVAPEPAAIRWPKRRLTVLIALALAIVSLVAYLLVTSFSPRRPVAAWTPDSIAVLPFHAVDSDGSDELLGRGIAEEVLGRLADFRSLTVIARTSSFALGQASLDPVDVAERLGVQYLVEGNLQRDGELVRIRVRLLDRTGRQLWSRSFDRASLGLFEVQDEIAAAVVASIAPQLEAQRGTVGQPNADAYEYYLLGREHMRLGSWTATDAAIAAFQQAIELDPQFARPYGGLAMIRAVQSGLLMYPVSFSDARRAAEQALALDSRLAEAHAALGLIASEEGKQTAADASLRRALDLDPDLVDARHWLSNNLLEQGRYAESERELEKGLAIDPLHPVLNSTLANRYWSRGDYEGARRRYVRILDLPDPPVYAHFQLVKLHIDFGRLEEALRWAKLSAQSHADADFRGLDALILAYARLGMIEEADRWRERLRAAEGSSWIGVNSEFLYMLGRFEEVHALNMEFLAKTDRPLRELPFVMQEVVGGFQVLTRRYDEGIAALEPLFADSFRTPVGVSEPSANGNDFVLTFAQFLAYGYRQVGRDADAERMLGRIQDQIDRLRRANMGNWPNMYVVEARNYALRGESNTALAALRQAVNTGWRDYAFERHNPCWASLHEEPEYQSLIAVVESDIAAQRKRVEAQGRDEDFERRVIAALAQIQKKL